MNLDVALAFRLKDQPCEALVDRYCRRIEPHRRIRVLADGHKRALPRVRTWRVLCAAEGETLSTEAFAERWRRQEVAGTQTAQFLVGGSDGWPGDVDADLQWSFGRITLPHQLAAVVLCEQLYRALTIMLGHPYHEGHK